MNDSVERHSRISITQTATDGTVTHTDVRITAVTTRTDSSVGSSRGHAEPSGCANVSNIPVGASDDNECFDPTTCCDEREQAVIAALRAYLRPQQAPECLMVRLRDTLDHCCGDDRI